MEDLAKLGIVLVVIVAVAIAAYMVFGGAFKSPQETCALQGALWDPVRDICVPAGSVGASCAPLISNGTCQYGLSCSWSINPLVLFRECSGVLQYPIGGG